MASLLANLDLLASRNLPALKKAVGTDMDELADMIHEIKRLNPKPGLAFGAVQMQAVVPAGHWQAADTGGDWTLVSCTVSPGFRFEGFELAPPGFDITG